MDALLDTIQVASSIARRAPACVVTGPRRRIVARCQWPAHLSAAAQALSRQALAPGVTESAQLSAVPCARSDGTTDGVLVVAATGLDDERKAALCGAAQIVGSLGSAAVAELLDRLEADEPDASLARDVRAVMRSLSYNMQRAAALFGWSRPTLYKRLSELGVAIQRLPAAVRQGES